MKIKKYMIMTIIFIIVIGVIAVQAATTVPSNGVLYSNSNSTATTVEGALNELYTKVNTLNSTGDATAGQILSGKKALVKGSLVTGTMTDYGREPTAKRIGLYNGSVYLYVPDVDSGTNGVSSGEETGKITRAIKTPLTNFGNASSSQVLSGVSFTSSSGLKIDGAMKDYSSSKQTLTTDTSDKTKSTYRINGTTLEIVPAIGYWGTWDWSKSNINISASSLGLTAEKLAKGQTVLGVAGSYTSDATASASQILKGKTAYVNGSKVTGTMPNWTGTPQNIDAVRLANGRFEVAVAKGYHDYSWTGNSYEYLTYSQVANTIGLTADKIAKGQTIVGVTGTYDNASISSPVVHEVSYVNSCGNNLYANSDIAVGKYVVINIMESNVGTGAASNMTLNNGTILKEYKYSDRIIQIYKIELTSKISTGTYIARLSNCSFSSTNPPSGDYTLSGKSIWIKISA